MIGFKEMLSNDIHNVFLNTDEFAEKHIIIYDDIVYDGDGDGIPVVFTKESQRDKVVQNAEGLHVVAAVLYIAVSDLDGIIPEQKKTISINDGTALGETFYVNYKIITSSHAVGMVTLELEAIDE